MSEAFAVIVAVVRIPPLSLRLPDILATVRGVPLSVIAISKFLFALPSRVSSKGVLPVRLTEIGRVLFPSRRILVKFVFVLGMII